jgi:AcrR family transcriptional regulator
MPDPVKPVARAVPGSASKRAYDSTRRREQAAASRRAILAAAQRLFTERGYAATTMAQVAEAANVSLKTVYLAFEAKAGLVRALWDVSLRGEPDIAVANQPWYRAVLDEPDPRRKLALTAANSRAVKVGIGEVLEVIRGSAPADPDLAALWALIQTDFHANQGVIVQQLYDAGHLRADLTVAEGTDILWTLNHPDVWLLLVGARGWTPDRWEAWFADAAAAQLLR